MKNKTLREKGWIVEKGVFTEFDRTKMSVGGWEWWKLRLQPWKWKYVKKYGMFFNRKLNQNTK